MNHGNIIMKPIYLRRILWFLGIIMVINIAGIALLGVMVGGAKDTPVMMTRMDDGMAKMVGDMGEGKQALINVVNHLKTKFPPNQLEQTTRQVLGIIKNVYKVSENAVSPREVENAKLHIMSIIERVDTIVSSIPADNIARLMTTISNVNTSKINELIDSIIKIHEIGIKIKI